MSFYKSDLASAFKAQSDLAKSIFEQLADFWAPATRLDITTLMTIFKPMRVKYKSVSTDLTEKEFSVTVRGQTAGNPHAAEKLVFHVIGSGVDVIRTKGQEDGAKIFSVAFREDQTPQTIAANVMHAITVKDPDMWGKAVKVLMEPPAPPQRKPKP